MEWNDKLIMGTLGSLFLLFLLSVISGNNFISASYQASLSYQQALNGSISEIGIQNINTNFSLDPLIQAVIWISIIGGVGVASGITVLSSGLGEGGQRWLLGLIFYVSIWIMFSTLPYPLIVASGTFGNLLYFIMTLFYAVGVIIKLMT